MISRPARIDPFPRFVNDSPPPGCCATARSRNGMYHAFVNADGSIGVLREVQDFEKETARIVSQQKTWPEIDLNGKIGKKRSSRIIRVQGHDYVCDTARTDDGSTLRHYVYRKGQLILANLVLSGKAKDREVTAIRAFDQLF